MVLITSPVAREIVMKLLKAVRLKSLLQSNAMATESHSCEITCEAFGSAGMNASLSSY